MSQPTTWTWGIGPWTDKVSGWKRNAQGIPVHPLSYDDNGVQEVLVRTTPDYELNKASNRTVSLKLWEPSEAKCNLLVPQHLAPDIKANRHDMFVRRNGVDIFRGRVDHSEYDIDGETGTVSVDVSAIDYRQLLDRQPTGVPFRLEEYTIYKGKSVFDTFVDRMIPGMGALGMGFYGPTPPTGYLGYTTKDITFSAKDSAFKVSKKLLESSNYFDFWIDSNLQIHVSARRGENKGVVLDYGGMVTKASIKTDTTDFANAIVQYGAEKTTADKVLDGQLLIAAQTEYPEGILYSWFEDSELNSAAKITASAKAHLDELVYARPTVEVTLRPGAWEGPNHIWLGDTVEIWIKIGAIYENFHSRVHGIDIEIDDDGVEQVHLSLWRPSRSMARKLQEMQRDLANRTVRGKGMLHYG